MTQSHMPDNKQSIQTALEGMLQYSAPLISTKQLFELRQKENVVLLDSREQDEFTLSHLPDAIWVGYDSFKLATLANFAKHQKIVVYCSIGVRSEKIAEKLVSAGFTHVHNLYGGIFTWANEGKPLLDNSNQPTFNVHGYDKHWAKMLEPQVTSPQKQ